MHAEGVGSLVVVDAAARAIGIVTNQDIVAALAKNASAHSVVEAMTPNPFSLPGHALAYEAAVAMIAQRIRHVLVTEDGRLAGVVSERDLFSLQRLGLGELAMEIRLAASIEVLAGLAGEVRALTRTLVEQGVGGGAADAVRLGAERPHQPARHRDRAQAPRPGADPLVLARVRQRRPLRADLQHRPGQRALVRDPRRRPAGRGARAPAAVRARSQRGARRLRATRYARAT